jgi:hypothetical protein
MNTDDFMKATLGDEAFREECIQLLKKAEASLQGHTSLEVIAPLHGPLYTRGLLQILIALAAQADTFGVKRLSRAYRIVCMDIACTHVASKLPKGTQ